MSRKAERKKARRQEYTRQMKRAGALMIGGAIVFFIIPMLVLSEIDLSFIPSHIYKNTVQIYLIIISAILFILCNYIVFSASKKKKVTKTDVQAILALPFVIYGSLYISFSAYVSVFTHYVYGSEWRQGYLIESVESCPSDYGYKCRKIHYFNHGTGASNWFRWYENPEFISSSVGDYLTLSGYENIFGRSVDYIER